MNGAAPTALTERFRGADRSLVERAFSLAKTAHEGQMRRSGEPYLVHPVAVAQYLADLGFDATSVAAALMHDVLEDSAMTRDQLEAQFGSSVAFLVDGVTKLSALSARDRARASSGSDLQTESLKKMFFAMAEDLRVIIIKLADRRHNLMTLKHKEADARRRIALQSMDIYAPIAARLGMGRLKGELEDLSFPYAYPEEYSWLKKRVKGKYEDRLRYIERTAPLVCHHLTQAGVAVVDTHARAKRMWSLYTKLQRYDSDPDKVLDLVALRIIVPDIKSCYEALGIIHAHYKPMPGRIKDYIALPKPNGYRSLHTTVFCEKGRVAEIQIRTTDMHDHAENGVAAHWSYKEGGASAKQQELAWVNQLKQHLRNIKTSQGIADLTIDFFKNRIFALTPQGDVKDLPEGATPVDFAYAVHSEIGHRLQGAIVNGKLVPISTALQSGDVVEIQKGKEARPSKDWLRFIKTNQAAKHIRAWFRRKQETTGEVSAAEEVHSTESRRPKKGLGAPSPAAEASALLIAGQPGLAYRIGRCCAPAAGTSVAGYLTLNRGVTVHRTDCANIKAADKRRLMDARWS